ncbi:hypothetical protein CLOP_g9683 [Closterium sp. NIES-67]|nr:hypothetical protein CLOP_g9683 [Closterium sp. NIES-67]
MDRSGLLSHASPSRRPTALAYVPVALTLGLFTIVFCARLFSEPGGDGSALNGHDASNLNGGGFLPKLFSLVSNDSLALHLRELTANPHIAGTPENFETARYVKERFESYGLKAHHADYPVLLSYPLRQSLRLVRPVALNFSLREQPVHGDPYSASRAATDPFNAYSGSGRVGGGPEWARRSPEERKREGVEGAEGARGKPGREAAEGGGEGAEGEAGGAEVVYANYGRMEDFEELVAAIGREKVTGTVALIRYGKTFRGDKVRNAEKFGVAAVLLYSDPADYAPEGTDASHVYPQAEWLPALARSEAPCTQARATLPPPAGRPTQEGRG